MGFNKRWVNQENCFNALKEGTLNDYFGKSDVLFFRDETSSFVHDLYLEGKSEEEILSIINQKNMEETNYADEMYQSNQKNN